jgi:S-DNA-T family DNA segregation ATPase FtsK/SpoIIIE
VSSGIDSRIILDAMGAEKLLGRGDMLFHPNGAAKPSRLQCAFVSDEEVERIVDYFKKRKTKPVFDQQIVDSVTAIEKGGPSGGVFGEGKQEDELLGEAVRTVIENGQASISMIQRRLRVGYARAARLVDMMEQKGYVSGFDGSKARKVLIKFADYEALFGDSDAPPPEAEAAMPIPDLDGPIDI